MLRTLLLPLVLIFLLGAVTVGAELSTFTSEREAQQHCPQETVVWLNLPTGIYHFRGERWYGRTKRGAFVCRREANLAGYQATRNGQ